LKGDADLLPIAKGISILDNHLKNVVEDINNIGKYQYLVMCIDVDEVEVDFRIQEVEAFFKSEQI